METRSVKIQDLVIGNIYQDTIEGNNFKYLGKDDDDGLIFDTDEPHEYEVESNGTILFADYGSPWYEKY